MMMLNCVHETSANVEVLLVSELLMGKTDGTVVWVNVLLVAVVGKAVGMLVFGDGGLSPLPSGPEMGSTS